MAQPTRISPVANMPTPIILGIVLLVLILIGAWFYLSHQGKSPSNPTQGHTALRFSSASA